MSSEPAIVSVHVDLPVALVNQVIALANLADVSPATVLKLAAAHEIRRSAVNEPVASPVTANAPATRFTPGSDDTVLDTTTGLTWSRTLQRDGELKRMTHAEAEKACAALGPGWRLPTRAELMTLVDDTKHDPCIDAAAFSDTQSGWYWTGTPAAWNPSSFAWIVNFGGGNASYGHRDGDAFVRAVRSPGQ